MQVRVRHLRHRRLERLRHSKRFKSWLSTQASRLSLTQEEVFELLLAGNTSAQVEAMEPEEPEEPEDP